MTYQDVGTGPGTTESTSETAKEQAGRVGQTAAQAGGDVARTAREQAANVAGEAEQRARDLLGEARGQARDQAGAQKQRAVKGLHGLSDELEQMAGSGGGLSAEVARQVSGRARELARHLDRHEPVELLDQVREYARRRPLAFLAGAALAGVVAGRLTRGLTAQDGSGHGPDGLPAGGAAALPPAEPVTDIVPAAAATSAPLADGPLYDPTPTPTPAEYQQPYGAPDGGFRTPEERTPEQYRPDRAAPEQYPGTPPADAYPGEEPYPPAPPAGYDPAYEPPQRGWNP
ncbi:MAG TPA: hypothetical protein VF109_04515 [Mycobacteriales bacterium]